MYLKRIQLSGFKSFADRVVVPLDKGINGIVGPNGAGKSNVIDAVRWVMGEQNARTLRGKVATDIIFSGSAKRKAVGMVEVTLVFDNTEESIFCPPEYRHEPEISLTRRLYVDGEREFLINKKPCRLKDILNFFAITGLGGKSYSMIQQGQVDRILNAKPEDVRIILEEAAGTLIYKTRKDEALKKLNITKDNLARITDILSELERQKSNLKGQMEKAQMWQELSSELKEKEIALFVHDHDRYTKQITEFKNAISGELQKEAELLAEISKLEARHTELQQMLDESDPDLQRLHEAVSQIREEIGRAEATILHAGERIETSKRRLEELSVGIQEDLENLQMLEQQAAIAAEELSSASTKAQNLQDQIDSFQDQVDAVDEEARVYENRLEDLEDELKSIDRMLESNALRSETVNRELEKIQAEIENASNRSKLLENDLSEASTTLDSFEKKLSEKKQGLDLDVAQKDRLESALLNRNEVLNLTISSRDVAKEKYLSARAKYNSLLELKAEFSSIGDHIDKLLEQEEDCKSVVEGLIADFVGFNKKASELSENSRTAIERWAERVVVRDIDNLNTLARFAHKHKFGILPVTVVSQWHIPDETLVETWRNKYDAEPLATYLKVTKENPAVSSLLKRLYYLPQIALSVEEINDIPEGLVVFTSQGISIYEKDEFVIGSTSASGLLSRKAELEKLNQDVKVYEAELAKIQSQIDLLEQKQNEDHTAVYEINEKLKGQNKDVLDVLAEHKTAQQVLENKSEVLNNLKSHLNSLIKNQNDLIRELEEQGERRISLGGEQDRVNREIESLRFDSESIQEKKEEVFRQHEARKRELAKAEGRLGALQASFGRTKEQVERLQSALSRRYGDKSRLEQEIEDSKTAHAKAEEDIKMYLAQRETLEDCLSEKREENAGILEESRSIELRLRALQEELRAVQKICSGKDVEIERLKTLIENGKVQAMEKYHVDLENTLLELNPSFDFNKTSREVRRLRTKVEELGSINMMAIEEYGEIEKRYDFIGAQKDEIVRSVRVLEDAVEEMEEVSKNKFGVTFDQVNSEFSNLFPILFPGGEAKLELSNPEDLLATGVEILARLPGKKLQRMTLLSGGEKALTAISLIFALLKTKPTPFCFLDEVDAALDEANVGRFNRVIEALSERFQFVIITHNRRTIEILDTLFGVTMQEPGVSKIVGVDMKRDIPPHLQKAFKDEKKIEGASASLN